MMYGALQKFTGSKQVSVIRGHSNLLEGCFARFLQMILQEVLKALVSGSLLYG